jgi:DNA excision repair protein ERCC-3
MSLDLPEATCLIQISSQFGSRRQEAQRMGRILRAKRRHEEGFRSRFYTLLSKDTDEVFFSTKRKRFLVDQGYEFKVVTDIQQQIENTKDMSHYLCSSKKEQLELLKLVMQQSEEVGEDETVSADVDDIAGLFQQKRVRPSVPESDKPKPFQRLTAEQKQKRDQNKERHKKRNPLFKAWAK